LSQDRENFEQLNTGVFKYAALGMAYLNKMGRFILCNSVLQKQLGYSEDNFSNLLLSEILHPSDTDKVNKSIQDLLSEKAANASHQVRCFDHKGSANWIRLSLSIMPNASKDQDKLIIAILEDINDELNGLDHPTISRQLFEAIAESIPTTVWLSDINGKKMHFVNQAFLDTWHVSKEEAYQDNASDLLKYVHPDDQNSVSEAISSRKKNDRWKNNFRIITSDKKTRYLESTGIILRDSDSKPAYLLGTHQDVTERVIRTAELENLNQQLQVSYEEVTRLNQFDSLTSCFNRTAVLVYISNAYYQFMRYEIPSSVIFIDLNKFKLVNDQYGHNAGDLVLKTFVQHMQERIRKTDTIGRLGGDEFILLLPGTNAENSSLFLQKEKQTFITQLNEETEITLSYSAGIAECDFSFNTVEEWIDASDKAMYAQKALIKS